MNTKTQKYDPYDLHEVLDRSYMIGEMVATYLIEHEWVRLDAEARQLAETAHNSLLALYQHTAKESIENDDYGLGV